ncbi:hypothetical protein SLE2022_067550 [Rubroshorea leprosula]
MAAFEHFKDMCGVKLKPPMLRTLIKKHLPEQKQPLQSSFELAKSWTSAIDDWGNRILLLVSSNMPEKCWVGICLLGLTCQECSSAPFLSSYSIWFQKLLSHFQPPADSQLVKVASCTSLSDLLTRLGRFSHCRSCMGWSSQSLTYHYNTTFFPASIHNYYDKAEAAVASKILSGKCSPKMLKKLGCCLTFLPKTKGDEDSWSFTMQKILVLINDHLSDVFQGLEEEAKSAKVRRLLVPVGKDPPPPLGGHTSLMGGLDKTIKRSDQLLTSSVSTLMICCCKLLTSSYPVQGADGGQFLSTNHVALHEFHATGVNLFRTSSFAYARFGPPHCSHQGNAQEAIHLTCICKIIFFSNFRSMHGSMTSFYVISLPHAAEVVRLVTKYFRRCGLPKLRTKLYSITRILLISMGVGMAIYLAQDVIDNAYIDLNPLLEENVGTSVSNPNSTNILAGKRKRKQGASFGSSEQQDKTSLEVGALKKHKIVPISLKMAALEALEALLMVGGALGSESWRSTIDNLLIMIATYSCKGGWANEENDIFISHESSSILADFQLAALCALLASLLAPAHFRPPYLSQGLDLFRRGKQEAGTKIARFCAHALLMLEVLIHPRALALADSPPSRPNSSKGVEHGAPELDYDDDDFLLNFKDSPEKYPVKNMKDTVEPFKTTGTNFAESLPLLVHMFQEVLSTKIATTNEVTGDPQGTEQFVSIRSTINHEVTGNSQGQGTETELGRAALGRHEVVSGVNVLQDKVEGVANISGNTPSVTPRTEKGKDPWDSDSSTVSFPDIVDADPDSDSD